MATTIITSWDNGPMGPDYFLTLPGNKMVTVPDPIPLLSVEDPTDPEIRYIQSSALCSLLPRPLILTGLFREILTRHFASPDNIETPELAHLLWQEGETSGILIESIHRWRPELTEHRPAVIIKRNAYANQRVGIADRLMGPIADSRGTDHYSTFWAGSHTLFCIGGSGAQADLLGTEVCREIHHFHPVIRGTALLHRLEVKEVGAIAELEEATENFVVPVTVAYAYEDHWALTQERPTLQSLRLSFMLDC